MSRTLGTGVVYLIGAGPGDPALITVRGAALLSRCDVVLYDALAHPALLERLKPGAEARFVGKRGGDSFGGEEAQDAINRELVTLARRGLVVGRLKGGDPLLFARGAEEALFLAREGVRFEIVPGISSPVAVSAYAGIPLTHRDLASSVLFLTGTAREGAGPDGHDWRRLATRAGTICVLMGMRRLAEIAETLIAHGRAAETPTAVVQWGARPEQRVITAPLSEIAALALAEGFASPALVVIGEVVRLREEMRWFDNRPLFGKRVLVTRAKAQSSDIADALRELGAEPVILPTITIVPPKDGAPLARAARELGSYDWVALTSANGVAALFDELARAGLDARAFGSARVAAIGPGTASALLARGVRANLVPDEHVGEALARAILAETKAPRVLLPRAEIARDALPDAIRAAGGVIDVVAAYASRGPSEDERAALRDAMRAIDVVTLTASSTVENLVAALGADASAILAKTTVASIGPVTTATATRLGVRVDVTATTYTIEAMLAALEAHFLDRAQQFR